MRNWNFLFRRSLHSKEYFFFNSRFWNVCNNFLSFHSFFMRLRSFTFR
ncbi:unnamed protein product [Larinioides sclopetarius]|uniref:Uncharacterized protein n=1 Tax=Larinioides sclopetarius TaxID=280406 RepID=A0AAV2ACG6_9ARAC